MYELQQGANEAKIVEQAQRLNMPLPEKIRDKPRLRVGLEFYWRAFWELSTDRDIGMAEGPIPWTAIHWWAARHDIRGEEFDRLVLLIKAMDVVYIEERSKSQKKSMDRASKKGQAIGQSQQATKNPIRTHKRN